MVLPSRYYISLDTHISRATRGFACVYTLLTKYRLESLILLCSFEQWLVVTVQSRGPLCSGVCFVISFPSLHCVQFCFSYFGRSVHLSRLFTSIREIITLSTLTGIPQGQGPRCLSPVPQCSLCRRCSDIQRREELEWREKDEEERTKGNISPLVLCYCLLDFRFLDANF